MSKQKRYSRVSDMVKADSSPGFAEALEKRIAERQLVKKLQVLRTQRGLSQEDVAAQLGCTQSRISKLENGKDSDLSIGDLLAYASVAGYQMQFGFIQNEATLVDHVKYHFFETKRLMEKLVGLANMDEDMAKGIAGFFGETCCNFVGMLIEKVKALANQAKEHVPLVKLVSEIGEGKTDKDKSKHVCHANGHTDGAPALA